LVCEAYLSDQSGGTSYAVGSRSWASVHFTAANVIGNIGAPLTDGDSLDEWSADADEGRDSDPPPPMVCDDPFTVGLFKEEASVEMMALGDVSGSSNREHAADENAAIERSAV